MNAIILSYAQDTNGQNQRYVEAARKHGKTIKALAIGHDDPAGVVGRMQRAASKREGLSIRSAHRTTHYFDWPVDLVWDRHSENDLKRLILEADVVHLNNSYRPAQRFRIRKPMLLHHHGSMFRNNAATLDSIARQWRMVQAVSTIDLLRHAPNLHWLPTAYDIAGLRAFGDANRREPDGKVRVIHCPTDKAKKNTDTLEAAVRALQDEGLPVELELLMGKSNAEVIAAKAQADILYDQLTFGYGCNSVEAWGLGLPVLSGGDDWTIDRMRQEWGYIPFYEATEETLLDRLRELVMSADLRAEWAQKGTDHVLRYHDEQPALEKLAELYVMAMKTYDKTSYAIPEVTFEQTLSMQTAEVWVRGDKVIFTDGRLTTTDPDVVSRLRYLAKRPVYGIREVA